ncbi:hypothetical protein NE865_10217 [Phthorimaea operculella]|nr:hypothetical protein NE865_10217 [Phthorimaea operculella]
MCVSSITVTTTTVHCWTWASAYRRVRDFSKHPRRDSVLVKVLTEKDSTLVMRGCNYDGIFHRVFCVALLAVAFTFTVILTNVFVDIDGLLASKAREDHHIADDKEGIETKNEAYQLDNIQNREYNGFIKEGVPDLDMDGKEENKNPFQNKVIVENNGLLSETVSNLDNVHVKEESNKKLVADIDNALVKEENNENNGVYEPNDTLEGQEYNELLPEKYDDYRSKRSIDTPTNKFYISNPKLKEILNYRLSTLLEELDAEETQNTLKDDKEKEETVTSEPPDTTMSDVEEKNKNQKEVNDTLHTAMHDIILQGIIGHMDLHDVYKKVLDLTKGFEQATGSRNNIRRMNPTSEAKGTTSIHVHSDLVNSQPKTTAEVTKETLEAPQDVLTVESKIFDEMVKCDDLHKQIDVQSHVDADNRRDENNIHNKKAPRMILKTIIDIKFLNQKISNGLLNTNNIKGLIKLIYNGKPVKFSEVDDEELENNHNSEKLEDKQSNHVAKEDEENIMDHFINHALAQYLKKYPLLQKKLKAQRPKRSVKKALRKDNKQAGAKAKTTNIFKKRLLNPLTIKEEYGLKNKIIIPVEGIVLRHIDPLSKSVKAGDYFPKIYDRTGEEWRKAFTGSAFLSDMKSINSGETGKVDLDYNQVTKLDGLPQRLQQPINSDNIRHVGADDKEYFNIGDLQFFIKDIDGTGFSIGFNQYVGEAPDPESIKTFTGLQQLINVYNPNDDTQSNSEDNYFPESEHEISKRDISAVRDLESIFSDDQATDLHSKDLKFKFVDEYIPYDSYSKTIDDGHKKVSISIEKKLTENQHKNNESVKSETEDDDKRSENDYNNMPFLVDENLLKKPLNPSEILSLANMLHRKKRSPRTVKRYSNLKKRGKPHINRYLNTHRRSKMIYKIRNKKQRSKRQVDKIRIIAANGMSRFPRHSDENVFVVTGENIFADAAARSDIITPEQEQPENEENNEFVVAHHHMTNQLQNYNNFGTRSRHNTLMSKYPHLFLDEITRSDEEQDNSSFYKNVMDHYEDLQKNLPTHSSIVSPFETKKAEILYPSANYYGDSSDHGPKFKLTFKVVPKNQTDAPSGFKSVHTSINKTINRNGLLYLSQMNVSELSKVEHILNGDGQSPDKTAVQITDLTKPQQSTQNTLHMDSATFPLVKHIKDQQEQMKILLKHHKERIDEQLDSLKQEKKNLDNLIVHSCAEETTTTAPVNKQDLIEVLLPLNPPQMLHLDKQQAGQLISNALMKLHDAPNLNDVSNQINPQQRNENLTNTILNKIDRNTNMLQNFLEKLADRLQPAPRPALRPADFLIPEWKSKEWKGEPYFSQSEMNKNATHKSIPFVYAYQQPSAKKRDTNTKQTFFLDDLEPPRLKPVPVPIRKEPYDIPRTKNNNTNTY